MIHSILILAALIIFVGLAIHSIHAQPTITDPSEESLSDALTGLRPPAVPLIACDPYFSIWSRYDRLTDGPTTHWTGQNHRLTAMIRISNKTYRMMGDEPRHVPAMDQTSLLVWPTRTVYTFEADGIKVTLTFMTPLLPEDLSLCARPITYLTWSVVSTDGQEHDVAIYFDADGEIAVNKRDQQVVWGREAVDGLTVLRVGSEEQPLLEKRGDDLRIDWGYFYVASEEIDATASLAPVGKTQGAFIAGKALPQDAESIATSVEKNAPVLAFAFDLGKVGDEPVERMAMLAYDDIYSVRYFYDDLRPYWRKDGTDAIDLLTMGSNGYSGLRQRCEAFDAEVVADLIKVGGDSYAQLGVLSYRQALAAQKIMADANGQPIMMSKENYSNGCIATVDVLYPASPQMLIFSPTMLKASLLPIMDYSASRLWPWDSAPHDLGTYPLAVGQIYGDGGSPMPVEESGNMLVMMAALSHVEGNADFAEKYWPTLTEWYGYLMREGLDPAEQLCTDDFAGHLARNANLSIKAIMGIAGYGRLCELTGRDEQAKRAFAVAREYALEWVRLADDGDHYVLAFGAEGTWSQKYNLVWDKLLDLNIFPDKVVEKEMAFYKGKMNQYGLPLDNRRDYTKLDWEVWTATLADDANFRAFVDVYAKWANETPSRSPMTDWYDTKTGDRVGFTARSVVGGNFIGLMRDKDIWMKYANRDNTKTGEWADFPINRPGVRQILATADLEPMIWRYTTDEPPKGWEKTGFDDSAWDEGPSGFGTIGTPYAVVGTVWDSDLIHLRHTFDLPEDVNIDDLRLRLSHDEDVKVYLNGELALNRSEYRNDYVFYPISAEATGKLKPGKNTIAAVCRQTGGGQYIDVGLVQLEETDE